MSFRQIFDRIARLARAEIGASRASDYERELRRAEELIEESRGARRTTVEEEAPSEASAGEREAYLVACRTIGVAPGATREQIVAAYRERARSFHPDRVSHRSESEQRDALRRMQELNLAYEFLVRRSTGNR